MVRFWGYSGDVGSVWFLHSGGVKSITDTLHLPSQGNVSRVKPYVSRVKKSLGRRQKPVLVIVGKEGFLNTKVVDLTHIVEDHHGRVRC